MLVAYHRSFVSLIADSFEVVLVIFRSILNFFLTVGCKCLIIDLFLMVKAIFMAFLCLSIVYF